MKFRQGFIGAPACLLPEGGGAGSFWDQGGKVCPGLRPWRGRVVCPALSWWCVCSTEPFRRGSWDSFWSWCVSLPIICPSCLEKRAEREGNYRLVSQSLSPAQLLTLASFQR